MTRGQIVLAVLVLLAGCSIVSAQEASIGAGKMELGGFPGAGTFFQGGDNNTAVNFATYTAGGGVTWYLSSMTAIEGEFTGSIGWPQDVFYHNTKVLHTQMPNTWTYQANVVIFPGGTHRRMPFYVTGGAGLLSLQSRLTTKSFGLDPSTVGWLTFPAENLGGGIKIFRASDAPNWGFRVDYRVLLIQKNSSDPGFFAQNKGRFGHRVYVGMLYTLKR